MAKKVAVPTIEPEDNNEKQIVQSEPVEPTKPVEPKEPIEPTKPTDTKIYSFEYREAETEQSIVNFAKLIEKATIELIDNSQLQLSLVNPRENLLDDIEILRDSIRENGLAEPLKVLKSKVATAVNGLPGPDTFIYEVLQGNRRLTAIRLLVQEENKTGTGVNEWNKVKCLVFEGLNAQEIELLRNDHGYQKSLGSKLEFFLSFSTLYSSGLNLPKIAAILWPLYCNLYHVNADTKEKIRQAAPGVANQLKINRMKGYLQQCEVGYNLPDRLTIETNDPVTGKPVTTIFEYPFKEWFKASLTGKGVNKSFTYEVQKQLLTDIKGEKDVLVREKILTGYKNDYAVKDLLEQTKEKSGREPADKRPSVKALQSKIDSYANTCPAIAKVLSLSVGEPTDLTTVESDMQLVDWLKSVNVWDTIKTFQCIRKGMGGHQSDPTALLVIKHSKE